MKIDWRPRAWEDYERWHETDVAVWKRINALVRDIQQDPSEGLGRPKALQIDLKGWWAREIDETHRLVYRVVGKGRKRALEILQCYGHYND